MNLEVGKKLERDGADVLAFPVGVGRSEFALRKLAELRKLPALIIRNGEVCGGKVRGSRALMIFMICMMMM